MLRALPGVFVAGEMLDWEAPTGGYLITGCLATGLGPGATRRPGQAFDARSKDGRSRIRRVWARNGSVTGNFALIAQFMQWASRMSGIVSSVAHQVGAILRHAKQELSCATGRAWCGCAPRRSPCRVPPCLSPSPSASAPVRQHRQPDQRSFHHRHLWCEVEERKAISVSTSIEIAVSSSGRPQRETCRFSRSRRGPKTVGRCAERPASAPPG
jgi:hypothetical protein